MCSHVEARYSFACLVCAVTRVHPLQVVGRLCSSLCGTAERTAGLEDTSSPGCLEASVKAAWRSWYYREVQLLYLLLRFPRYCTVRLKTLFLLFCAFYIFFGEKCYKPLVLSRVRLCDPTDCSLPGSSACGISQERTLEWVAISYSMGSSQPKWNKHLLRLLHWQADPLPPEPPGKPTHLSECSTVRSTVSWDLS